MSGFVGVVGYIPTDKGVKLLPREQLDLSQIEQDLKSLLEMLERTTEGSKIYAIDEIKVTIGAVIDEQGKVTTGLFAGIAGLLGSRVSGEVVQGQKGSQILELIIKRKT